MDKQIERKQSWVLKYKWVVLGAVLLIVILLGYSFSDIGNLRVASEDIRTGVVKKGAFAVQVLGNGTVVPNDIDLVIPRTVGDVVEVHVKSGDYVTPGQLLFTLTNEELKVELSAQSLELAESNATLASRSFELDEQLTKLEFEEVRLESEFRIVDEKYQALRKLMNLDVPPISALDYSQAKIRAEQFRKQWRLAVQQVENFKQKRDAQLEQYRVNVTVAEKRLENIRQKVDSLSLKAKKEGVIQEVEIKPGQRLNLGQVLGKIVSSNDIFVRLKVPAIKSDKLEVNQNAVIESNGRKIQGKVIRIDPNVVGASLSVDIALEQEAPFLKTNMYVSGEIKVFNIEETLFVEKMSSLVENSSTKIYVFGESKKSAYLKEVQFGEISNRYVQIKAGLEEGQEIILTDLDDARGAEKIIIE
ncbi:efflux RND transporter periplasmic adaptor subunit [Teredinibacter turnerae]|uniref:efflux RND transporter periplasmic adaptor subunit n=1 Tax=Teredinibacter turnerae TaxID=2426 RepID=UPI0004112860|nr:HlyD family efflux transporter periplasmic adaptor subunit [Teredinibacter turnerae]